jgi:hypothetical protein
MVSSLGPGRLGWSSWFGFWWLSTGTGLCVPTLRRGRVCRASPVSEQLPRRSSAVRLRVPSCSLGDVELRNQLGRYRAAGEGAEMIEWARQRRVIRVSRSLPEPLVERLIEVERSCCPFLELRWDRTSRFLTISVSTDDQVPALDAIGYSLGVG